MVTAVCLKSFNRAWKAAFPDISSYQHVAHVQFCCLLSEFVCPPGRWRAHRGHRHLWSCFGAWPRAPFGFAKALVDSWDSFYICKHMRMHTEGFHIFSFSPKMIITWEQNLIEFGVWEASDGGTGKRWIKKTLKRQSDDKIDLLWFVYMFCRLGKFVPHKGRLSSSKQTPLIWEPWPRTRDHKGREAMCSLQVYHKIQLEKHTALILLLLTWIDFT